MLGVLLHAIGGLAAASFYIPYKRVRGWSWESYWIVGGFISWIVMPTLGAALTSPGFAAILAAAPHESLVYSFAFGMLWGIGGLTFGLSMRYLGMSLGYALALGFCAVFGTLIPPIFTGTFGGLLQSAPGLITLAGVAICLAGIAICGRAGMLKERELSAAQKQTTIREFNFLKGVWVAIFAGVMSACMAFAIAAGKPIAQLAVSSGVDPLWQNNVVFIVIFAGGFAVNLVWCLWLNLKNRTFGDYLNFRGAPVLANLLCCAAAGALWYFQFMFYGMGTSQMARFDFSSWTLHMAFIIIFSNLWGMLFKEWRGTSPRAHRLVALGVAILILSTVVVGVGNYLGKDTASQPSAAAER